MPPVRWSHEALVKAPPDEVYRWMADFREDDHQRPAFLRGAGIPPEKARRWAAARRVLAREGDAVTIEDAWGRSRVRLRATLDAARREVRIEGEHGYAATWRAEPDGAGGTRLTVRGELAPRGLFGLLLPLFARRFQAQMAQDFRGHVADLEDELIR